MKNILLIAVCLIAVLGCDVSKYTGKNDNLNAPKPTPTASPSPTINKHDYEEKSAASELVSTLKKTAGKYPYEIKLLENAELKSRLQKLMGPDFAAMKANWYVETPIEIVDNVLKTTGCEQHNCPGNFYYIFVDLKSDSINVYHQKNGTRAYAEHSKISLPAKFEDELGNDQ